jgi:N-glycosylase/DNA lyase
MAIIRNVRDFHPDHTFDCGQCFRWTREEDGSYTGIAFGKPANIKAVPAGLPLEASLDSVDILIDNVSQQEADTYWRDYLDLGRDYGEIKAELRRGDPVMEQAIRHGYGIRILNQDRWETILSFLISQNNNIPRIRGCIESLCEHFGEPVGEYRGKLYYDIPTPERLAELTLEDLAPCRLGYRARYILDTARQVRDQGIEDTAQFLRSLCGVGEKVANCILLFSMNRLESFPVDVWVRRVMHELYGIPEKDTGAMTDYAARHFGPYGGIAQQYLFYYRREGQETC